ncbi:MAG: class I SAM-dependent methyltransferase [Thermovirgaceae bacterium]
MKNYYAGKLNAGKLEQVYETKIPRVRQYLDAEIEFVARTLDGSEKILELGAGYGRIMKRLAPFAESVTGIDISHDNVRFGKEYLRDAPNCRLLVMDAHGMEFDGEFHIVLCLQNGLSAIKGDPKNLVIRSVRALGPGGRAFFSTYSRRFWEHRLEWFQEQSRKGLLGEIDMEKTRDGRIVCKDGFTATTFAPGDLEALGRSSGCPWRIEEVDASSLFLILEKH